MSEILVREVVRDMIRAKFKLKESQCRVVDDPGKAPPDAGSIFIGVHPARWKQWGGWKQGPTLDEEFGVSVTISAKSGAIQPQLWGELVQQKKVAITSCGIGIDALAREIVAFLHSNEDLTCTLNTEVGAVQFTGGLYFADGGIATERQADWWRSALQKKDEAAIGMSKTISFYGLRRTQASGSDAT
jgi:hypothetical protein